MYEKEDDFEDAPRESFNMPGVYGLTISRIMGEDMDVWLSLDKKFGFTMDIDAEDGEPMARERKIHPFAVESLAAFCKQFLHCYDHVKKLRERAGE